MSKIILDDVIAGYNLTKINDNFDKIEQVINEQVLHRKNQDNLLPNTLEADIDANSHRIYNLPQPVTGGEPLRLKDLFGNPDELLGGPNWQNFIATQNQTLFVLNSSYVVGTNSLLVFRNGTLLIIPEYTETSSTAITLNISVDAGDQITVVPVAVSVSGSGGGGGGGSPTGPAGGVLSGTYPNPGFAVDMATQVELNSAVSTINSSLAGKSDVGHTHSLSTITVPGGSTVGHVATYNGSNLVLQAPSGGGGSSTTRIVVAGDSLTARQALHAPAWPELLEKYLKGSGVDVEVFDVAINGWTYNKANLTASFGAGVTMRDQIIAMNPAILIVALGFNDCILNVEGRTAAQVKADALAFFSAIKTALPSVKIIYASQLSHDSVHATNPGVTLLNRHVTPFLMQLNTSGLLANAYCEEILPNSVSATTQSRVAAWVDVDSTIKGYSQLTASYTMPIWKAARLGLLGYDTVHPTAEGSIFWAAAAREAFRTVPAMAAIFPNLSDQSYPIFNSPDTLFSDLVTDNGTEYISVTPPNSNTNHTAAQWGPWRAALPGSWFLPSKGQWKSNNTTNVQGTQFVWRVEGGPPLTAVEASADGSAFALVGTTDQRGTYLDSGVLSSLTPGVHIFRYRTGNEIHGPVSITVVAGSTIWTPKAVSTFGFQSSSDFNYTALGRNYVPFAAAVSSDTAWLQHTVVGTESRIRLIPNGKTVWYRVNGGLLIDQSAVNSLHMVGYEMRDAGGSTLGNFQLGADWCPVLNGGLQLNGSLMHRTNTEIIIVPWVFGSSNGRATTIATNGYGSYFNVEIITAV